MRASASARTARKCFRRNGTDRLRMTRRPCKSGDKSMNAVFETDAPLAGKDADRALRDAYRATEWRIMPILFVLWLLAWVDRANVAVAKLQMLSDLHFSETVYGLGAGL